MRLNPPSDVLEISERLEAAGYEAWCVGGAVRDALLGQAHLDWDFATSATPDQVRALFGVRRTIPVGFEFGTVGVLDRHGVLHEVTTFRRDVDTDGRHAVVEYGVSLDDDLARRDFTINAIAFSPSRGELRDPFHGREDLERRLVRAVGDPDARMREDRLRALRGIRFAARFSFQIEPSTLQAIAASAPFLGRLSMERVKQELEKTMDQVRCPSKAMSLWKSTGALATLVPAIAGIDQVTLSAIDSLPMPGLPRRPQRRLLRLAALFVGVAPAQLSEVLPTLRFSRQDSTWMTMLVERWGSLGDELTTALLSALVPPPPSSRDIRRWVAAMRRVQVASVMRLANAVWAARRQAGMPAPSTAVVQSAYRRMLVSAFRDPVELSDLAVNGDDLRAAGVPPGPNLGRILKLLLDAVLEDPACNTRDWLLQEAQRQARALNTT